MFNIIKDGQIIGTEATKADGSITVTDVTEGMYAFVEVSVPAPYATLTEPVIAHVDQAVINGGGTVFEIKGIHFHYHDNVITGPDGTVSLCIDPGTYRITEKSVPAPYYLPDKDADRVQTISLNPGDENAVVFRNHKTPELTIFKEDSVAGTRFDRPGFMAMMEEVEDGGVEAIIIKDMSRMGWDYLKVGQVMEILRQRGVRLIAINDNVDTDKGNNDMIPFSNIMYEFYARDTSKKIRSVFKAKGMSGKHLTGTVIYGYLWDEKREHWLVDEEAAAVVRRIFAMTLAGYGPYQIATQLTQDKVEIPSVHLARFNEGVNRTKPVKDIYGWDSSTIVHILKNLKYLGHTVNFKTRKHFKDKKSHYKESLC